MSYEATYGENTAQITGVIKESKAKLMGKLSVGGFGAKKYEGPYDITPQVITQVLETKSRTMSDDLTINPIPYHATSNESGITIYIGD